MPSVTATTEPSDESVASFAEPVKAARSVTASRNSAACWFTFAAEADLPAAIGVQEDRDGGLAGVGKHLILPVFTVVKYTLLVSEPFLGEDTPEPILTTANLPATMRATSEGDQT